MRRRAVLVLLALGLAAAGAALAYRELRPHAPNVVGSSTTEFTLTTTTAPPPSHAAEQTWPTYGFDSGRDRSIMGTGLRPPFRRVWLFHGHSLLEFPPVVAGGRVYVTTFKGILYALDARTGKTLWLYHSGRCGWASPAVAGGRVFETFIGNSECGSRQRDGEIAAFDARTGRRLWLRSIGPTESSPLVERGLVYVGDWQGRVWALRVASGKTRWFTQLDGEIKGSVASSGRRLFIGTYGGDVVSLAAGSGRVLWTSGGHGAFYSSPAAAYGRVYIGSVDDGVYAFGQATGHLLWSHPTGGYVYASPAVWNGFVLIGSYDHRFYALDAWLAGRSRRTARSPAPQAWWTGSSTSRPSPARPSGCGPRRVARSSGGRTASTRPRSRAAGTSTSWGSAGSRPSSRSTEVRPGGFEPPTRGLEVRRSVH
jgi:outer membrane protein assembly factor BamB